MFGRSVPTTVGMKIQWVFGAEKDHFPMTMAVRGEELHCHILDEVYPRMPV